jgi:NhaP-type Na+/H+ or K+/H+ antiporter
MSAKYEVTEDFKGTLGITRRWTLIKYAGLMLLGLAVGAVIYEVASWMGDAKTSDPYVGELVTSMHATVTYSTGISLTGMGIIFLLLGFTEQATLVDGIAGTITFETRNPVLRYEKKTSIPFPDIVDVSMNATPLARSYSIVILDVAGRIMTIYFSDVMERALEIKNKVQGIMKRV